MRKEVWKKVLDGWYEASNLGRIRRARYTNGCWGVKHVLKPSKDHDGYPQVVVSIMGDRSCYKVHQLVAAAFIGPCPEGKQVNHKDTVKTNNIPRNLEYMTSLENNHHRIRTVGVNYATGSRHGSKTHPERFKKRPRSKRCA